MARIWSVESLRLTLFSSEPISISDADWSVITGQAEAETRQNVAGGKRYIGKFGGGQLIVGTVGQRLDIVLSWLPPEQQIDFMAAGLPLIGGWDAVREVFVGGTQTWLEGVKSPILRMAFAAVLLSETKSVTDSYQVLGEMLKSVTVDPDGMREIIFRVNWPENSSVVKELQLNRITNWSAIQVSTALLQMTGQEIAATGGPPERFAVRLEIDHNTDQANKKPFEREVLVPIYNELIAKSCENAALGERP
jgi:hypothetical protein